MPFLADGQLANISKEASEVLISLERRISELEQALQGSDLEGVSVGIGHSRWATHGPPNDVNAHPHTSPVLVDIQARTNLI